jgi:Fur family iron response transcriptional regulator
MGPVQPRAADDGGASDESVARHLQHFGIQPTAQRLRVARFLLARPQHRTAEQILACLRADGSRVSKATVYNTLNLLAARGVIRQLVVDGDRAWFDSNVDPHFHFQDVETGSLTDLASTEVQFGRLPAPPPGMEVAGIELVIRLRRKID